MRTRTSERRTHRTLSVVGASIMTVPLAAAALGYMAWDSAWVLVGVAVGGAIGIGPTVLAWARRVFRPLDALLAPRPADARHGPDDLGRRIELERARYIFESRKIRIGVEFSSLSTASKDHCYALLDEAEKRLHTAESLEEIEALGDYVDTAGQLKGLIARESRTLLIYTLVTIAILGLVGWATWAGGDWRSVAYVQGLFGIPIAVLVWSGIGGLVSVLFRYMFQQAEYREPPLKALIVRPVVGVVLGTVTYFILASGFFVMSDGSAVPNTLSDEAGFLFLILAFLAGFSDRLAIFVLGTVVGRVGMPADDWLPRAADPGVPALSAVEAVPAGEAAPAIPRTGPDAAPEVDS